MQPRLASVLVVLFVVSCFGPYLQVFGFGLRTEQLFVYALLVFLVPFSVNRLKLNSTAHKVLVVLILQFVISLIAMFLVELPEDLQQASITAHLDTFLMPIATILVVATLSRPLKMKSSLLVIAGRAFVVMCAFNVLIALGQSQTAGKSFLSLFWTSDPNVWSVSEQAQLGLRYSGIFNQPAEAGFAYGLALVLIIFSCRFSFALSLVLAALMTAGGLLSASKVFYACAVIIAFYGFISSFRNRRIWKSLISFSIVMGLSIGVIYAIGLLPDRLERLKVVQISSAPDANVSSAPDANVSSAPDANGSGSSVTSLTLDVLNTYTAGRIGTGGNFESIADVVMSNSPILGFGFGGWQVAYDSTWIEALVIGGVVGLGLTVLAILVLFQKGVRMLAPPINSAMLVVLMGCCLVASLGIGALTANRVSTAFWTIVTLLAFGRGQEREQIESLPLNLKSVRN